MPGMPAVLLDQVADQPAQAGMAAIGPADVDQLGQSAVGQGRSKPGAGASGGAVPQGVELFGVSPAAEVNSQSLSSSHAVGSHGAPGGSPRSLKVKA